MPNFWSRRSRRREQNLRVQVEDALKHVQQREFDGRVATRESLAGILEISIGRATELLDRLLAHGFVQEGLRGYELTAEGRRYALHVIRVHRLWERYLADETDVAPEDLHVRAEKAEHRISPSEADALFERLGRPTKDPHGDPIPTAEGEIEETRGIPLSQWPEDMTARVIHLEDEPVEVYRRLMDQGIRLEMLLEITGRTPEGLTVTSGEMELELSPSAAANITVVDAEGALAGSPEGIPLSDLDPGEEGIIVALAEECRGLTRRRFMDLGLTPGGRVQVEMDSPFGDPRAYRIRGTVIALRRDQAVQIRVRMRSA